MDMLGVPCVVDVVLVMETDVPVEGLEVELVSVPELMV